MTSYLVLTLTVSLFLAQASCMVLREESCIPGKNCKLPSCRCWNDNTTPGNIGHDKTPQMLMLFFSYGLNKATAKDYEDIFAGIKNPNGCPASGTFFIQRENTDVNTLKSLHAHGHELGITTSKVKKPKDLNEWRESLFYSLEKLWDANITRDEIKGVMALENVVGGDKEMSALSFLNMKYDVSCLLEPNKLVWPYTLNYNGPQHPKCNMGQTPSKKHPNIWQFVRPEMTIQVNDTVRTCTDLSSCREYLKSEGDVFNFFYKQFSAHYKKSSSRVPYMLFIDPSWMTNQNDKKGLIQFLDMVRIFQNTWIVTMSEALAWVQNPAPVENNVTLENHFKPWGFCGSTR